MVVITHHSIGVNRYREYTTELYHPVFNPLSAMREIPASLFVDTAQKGASNAARTYMIGTAIWFDKVASWVSHEPSLRDEVFFQLERLTLQLW